MAETTQQYSGPLFRLLLDAAPDGSYQWAVEFSGANYSGTTNLGYRASGKLSNLQQPLGDFEICVHDKIRAAWTPMPLSHRKDLRQLIDEIVKAATNSVAAATPKHISD
ncbi:MAG TPA: hypothetical protein VGM17_17060 [Rhizomicrobium sp.]|jgi:hypothetical protein